MSLPGIGQEYLLAVQDLASAAAAEPQSPEKHTLLEKEEENPEAVEQPTVSSPSDESCGNTEQPARPRMAAPLFSPIGSQSTHGSSVGMRTPSLLPLGSAGPYSRSNSETGEGAFRDFGRGTTLYIRRARRMTGILTRTHETGPDTSTVQFRPVANVTASNWYTSNCQLHRVGGPSGWKCCSFRVVAHITCEVELLL